MMFLLNPPTVVDKQYYSKNIISRRLSAKNKKKLKKYVDECKIKKKKIPRNQKMVTYISISDLFEKMTLSQSEKKSLITGLELNKKKTSTKRKTSTKGKTSPKKKTSAKKKASSKRASSKSQDPMFALYDPTYKAKPRKKSTKKKTRSKSKDPMFAYASKYKAKSKKKKTSSSLKSQRKKDMEKKIDAAIRKQNNLPSNAKIKKSAREQYLGYLGL